MKKPITLLVAHHEPKIHRRLCRIFGRQKDIALMDPVKTDTDLVRMVRRRKPRVLFLDTRFVRGDGYRLVADIRQRSPNTKVIMLSNTYARAQEVKAAKAGAMGYIGGEVAPAMLRKAVQVTEAGGTWMRRKTVSLVLDDFLRSAPLS
jgi:DNA-binding NarL/FixJ family response regulator